ncbi:MAG: IS200/IS605 family transposase [Anaerolineae bacterium]|nr:IS200/IS605 family transposase [Anaerolineae bacterium]
MAIPKPDLRTLRWLNNLTGWVSTDAYSTAWVALVPALENREQPAWPAALEYLRESQLPDGGWGEPTIYYAHERTITTLAALRALHTWQTNYNDQYRIERGLQALNRYAADLEREPHEPVGFELLLPMLRNTLSPFYGPQLPTDKWEVISQNSEQKLRLISSAAFDLTQPRAWWFSLEMLPKAQLALLDDSILESNGSIVTSVAATAAYLYGRRSVGSDSRRAAAYLDEVMVLGDGGAPFCWPAEVFERVWVLDMFRRAGLHAADLPIEDIIDSVEQTWHLDCEGLSSSQYFRVNDGDDTLVGHTVLSWGGRQVSDDAILSYWDGTYFKSYPDERDASVSTNIHGLAALLAQPGIPHRVLAEKLTGWLEIHIAQDGTIDDKWHISPYYSVSHALQTLTGWQDDLARRCLDFLLAHQHPDGGWGHFGRSTLEETAHCIIGLGSAYERRLFEDEAVLRAAAGYFVANADTAPQESFWIGKTLFRPDNIVAAAIFSARCVLDRLDLLAVVPSEEAEQPRAGGPGRGPDHAVPSPPPDVVRSAPEQPPAIPVQAEPAPVEKAAREPLRPSTSLRPTSHALYQLKYVLLLKPRQDDLLRGDLAEYLRTLFPNITRAYDWELWELTIHLDHVRLVLSVAPRYSLDAVVEILKQISEREAFAAYPHLTQRLWAGKLWAEGYFVYTDGGAPHPQEIDAYLRD